MAPQLKQLDLFYDLQEGGDASFFGSVLALPFNPNRLAFRLNVQSDGPIAWSLQEISTIAEGHQFGVPDSITANYFGSVQMKWSDDYVLTFGPIFVFTAGTSGSFRFTEIEFRPERA